jgi:hypothetical protein
MQEVDLEKIKLALIKYPENFICDVCGTTKYQDQNITQRKGYPICHRMTMKVLD